MSNNPKAVQRADEIDQKIIDTLKSGRSFRVEAGAGAGKTYSLNKVVSWLEREKKSEFISKGLRVACITYTNAAVDVIRSRLANEDFIQPCTIHNFSWGLMKQFQSSLIKTADELDLLPHHDDGTPSKTDEIKHVTYELGVKYISDGVLYLSHDDVIKLFSKLLDNSKFRKLIQSRYAIILIDEYQDSFKSIMEQFLRYFIEADSPLQFGLFGDSWQTIYSTNGACGEVVSDKLVVIEKEINFRSQDNIVQMLNRIRPELPQTAALNENDGRIFVITCDDYSGNRQEKNHNKDELPDNILYFRINSVRDKLNEMGWVNQFKTLMITHKMLAKEQHYENLLELLENNLKNGDDDHYLFFLNRVEPVFKALDDNNPKLLFDALGVSRRPIESREQKRFWKDFHTKLAVARKGSIADVMNVIKETKVVSVPDKIDFWWNAYRTNNDKVLFHGKSIRDFYPIRYSEMLSAFEFQDPDSEFSTDHGVKGEEYESVLFVLGRGWNNYKFDEVIYKNAHNIIGKELESYIRVRNLFYVCCSRAIKNFALFITVPINGDFRRYLCRVFGQDNILSYRKFMDMKIESTTPCQS